jgi:putative ABC transport system permease protein
MTSEDWRRIVRDALPQLTGDGARDALIVDELAEHVAQRYDDLLLRGHPPSRALELAKAELAATSSEHRVLRAVPAALPPTLFPPPRRRLPMLDTLTQDVRYAWRLLRKQPAFTAAAVLTLTLGIGATTAIFSVVDGVLLRPVPFADHEQLMMMWETDRRTGTTREPSSVPDFIDFRERSRAFRTLAAFTATEATLTPTQGDPARLAALMTSSAFLPMLGLQPILGRTFTADEDRGGARTVIISEGLWDRLFQRSPDVIGRELRIDEQPRVIVGVMPSAADVGTLQVLRLSAYGRGFADRDVRSRVDLWLPLPDGANELPRDTHPILVAGRLAPGATRLQAQQEMETITADLERTYPGSNTARGAFVEPLDDVIFGKARPTLMALLAAVLLVLLIACVNVANLLLARGTSRSREVAVRAALGAGTGRLTRQFAVETLLLSLLGAVAGVALAYVAVREFLAFAPPDLPRLDGVAVNLRVMGAGLLLATGVGLAFGLVPVLQARRVDVQTALRAEESRSATAGRERGTLRSALVVAEVALAVVLVAGAGLLVKSIWRLQQVDAGFDAHNVLKAEFQLPRERYGISFQNWPNFVEVQRFNRALLERLRATPGVESVGLAGQHPLDAGFTNSFVIVGREAEARDWPEISVRSVAPTYFPTVKLGLLSGRLFTDGDDAAAPAVALINKAAADRFFEGRDPVGHRISFWGIPRTIVGVVADERIHGLTSAPPIAVYAPLPQTPAVTGNEVVLVRARTAPAELVNVVRAAIREIDPALAVYGVEPLEHTMAESIGQRRFSMAVLATFAVLALALAAVGIHGVLSYMVLQRRHEIGIRLALGATPRGVVALVFSQGARLAVIGLVLGVGGALLTTRVLASLLFGVSPSDPATLGLAAVVLGGVAMLATWLPARRTVRITPTVAMREG